MEHIYFFKVKWK